MASRSGYAETITASTLQQQARPDGALAGLKVKLAPAAADHASVKRLSKPEAWVMENLVGCLTKVGNRGHSTGLWRTWSDEWMTDQGGHQRALWSVACYWLCTVTGQRSAKRMELVVLESISDRTLYCTTAAVLSA